MILKIEIRNKGHAQWHVEYVAGIDYYKQPIEISESDIKDVSFDLNLLSKLEDWDFEKDLYRFNQIKVVNTDKVIIFDTIAYLCNDDGKTVDRIYGQ